MGERDEHWLMRQARLAGESMAGWSEGQKDSMRRVAEWRKRPTPPEED